MKTYHLTRQFILYMSLSLGIPTLFGTIGAAWAVIDTRKTQAPDYWIPLVFVPILLALWFFILRPPYKLTILDDNSVELKSLLGTTVVFPHEIKSIKARVLQSGTAELKHEKGTLRLFMHMDGFYEFLHALKRLNPNIEIRGC